MVALPLTPPVACCQKKDLVLANIRASQQRWMGMIPIGRPLYGEKECIEMVPGIFLHCFCQAGRYHVPPTCTLL